jgi:hypothetical protein
MGFGYKYDFKPLLAPGRHFMTLCDIERLCVTSFIAEARSCREKLYYALEEFVQMFIREKIPCEILVDGSFMTEKPLPDDVDVAALIDAKFADNMSSSQKDLAFTANEPDFIDGVDSFVDVTYPCDHEYYRTETKTWAEQFGIEHGETWLKGVAVLRIWETNVGLRIRR